MNLKEYRLIFIAGCLSLSLVAVTPTLGLIMDFSREKERFSELWVLGSYRMAKDYPFNISVTETYRVFVGVGNRMGASSYYLIYVKFGNQTQSLHNATASKPSQLESLYEYRAFVADEETWEAPLTFGVLETSRNDYSVSVRKMIINGELFTVNVSARWSSEYKGYYFHLLFELWLYNNVTRSFQFHDRIVGIWLNVTA